MSSGFDGGWRLGWDIDTHFGSEMRFAFGSMKVYDSDPAVQARAAADAAAGIDPANPLNSHLDHRNGDLFQWDVDILYYPCGETRLRPYFLTGMGITNVRFADRLDQTYHVTSLSLPIGVGLKYLVNDSLAVRLDCLDDIAFSSRHLSTQNNVSLTAGVELRFGGSRKEYWPWDSGRSFW